MDWESGSRKAKKVFKIREREKNVMFYEFFGKKVDVFYPAM